MLTVKVPRQDYDIIYASLYAATPEIFPVYTSADSLFSIIIDNTLLKTFNSIVGILRAVFIGCVQKMLEKNALQLL